MISESEEWLWMNYSTLDQTMEQVNLPVEIDALSVYRAMEHIEDGRHKRGVRYSVALIFTLILLAKGAGMTTPLAIAQWVRLRAGWLREVLPITCTSFPCAATYSNVLRAVDAQQVKEVLMQALTRVMATLCWLLGTSVHKIEKLYQDNFSFSISPSQRDALPRNARPNKALLHE